MGSVVLIDHRWISRVGLLATIVGSLGALVFVLGVGATSTTVGLIVALCVAAAAAALVASERVRRHPYEDVAPALVAWGCFDSVLIGCAMVLTGGAESPIAAFMVLPVVFFVPLLSRIRQIAVVVFALVTIVAADLIAPTPAHPPRLAVLTALIAVGGITSAYLARVLNDQREAHRATELVAERRAQLLALASLSARSLTTLESSEVVDNLLDAATRLGIDAAAVFTVDEQAGTATCVREAGSIAVWRGATHSLERGIIALAARTGRTQVVPDYPNSPHAYEEVVALGVQSVAAFPVQLRDRVSIVLSVGTRYARELAAEEIEAFELLALHAGQALDNAQRFERERAARARLEELDRLQEEFVATASHELRTPLTVISGFSHTLTDRWDAIPDGRRRTFLDRITHHADDLTRLVDQLTTFQQLEVGEIHFRPRYVRLASIIDEALARLGEERRARITVDTVLEPEDTSVRADADLLAAAIHALLDNVVQHTPAGTRVTISSEVEGPDVRVHVVDDGPGMSDVDLPRALIDFVRGGEYLTRRTRGMGLGLPTVRRILALHDAELAISSRPAGGTACRFVLRGEPLRSAGRRLSASTVLRLDDDVLTGRSTDRSRSPST